MIKFYRWLSKISNPKIIIAWVILYIGYFSLFMMPDKDFDTKTGDYKLLDLMQFFTPDEFYAAVDNYTQTGVDFYLSHVYLDFIYPLIYGFLFLLLMVFSMNKIEEKERKITPWLWLPMVAVVADYGENISFIYLLNLWPSRADAIVYVALFFNTVKWFSVYISFVVVVVGFYKFLKLKIRGTT